MKKPRGRNRCDPVDLVDEVSLHCRNIAALAELLAGCKVENLNPQAITHAGDLIFRESLKLHEGLEALYRQLPKSK